MDGSNGNIVGLLERIATATEVTNERLERLEARQEETNARLGRLESGQQRLEAGQHQVVARLDNVISFMGRHHADHERRIEALEERVFKKTD